MPALSPDHAAVAAATSVMAVRPPGTWRCDTTSRNCPHLPGDLRDREGDDDVEDQPARSPDPCPHPLPSGWNAPKMDWGQSNFVNPPFRKDDGLEGKGVVPFVRKAIAEAEKGKTRVIIMPVFDYITVLVQAGAEMRPLGRVPFRDVDDGHAAPANVAMFILRGHKS
jgi:hypothetical protein